MSTKKKSKPAAKKAPAKKAPAKRATAKKAPAKKAVAKIAKAPAKKKAASKPALKPKPKATHPSKKDVGIFGTLQKNIKEGISAIAGTVADTVLPSPKRGKKR